MLGKFLAVGIILGMLAFSMGCVVHPPHYHVVEVGPPGPTVLVRPGSVYVSTY